ncbi:MAG: hypothetical protein DRP76_01360 [Candidatus Omnitrophota bacterium]|nr:MAG: hypothetical protein DRP76_01360 [Candidatus Omnitrophota bacterium]
MKPSKPTINEVARKAGVSLATVSRFLANPFSVKEKNRKKIDEAVKELNYKPSLFARKLAGGRAGIYGLIIPGYEGVFHSYYALEIIRGIGFVLEELNIDLYLHIWWQKDNFNTSLVDGVIFADIVGNEEQLERIKKEGLPFVVLNKKMGDDISYVTIDNFFGGYRATEFLIKHGHRYIAHIAGDLRVEAALERLNGYKEALRKYGLEAKDEYIKVVNFSPLEAKKATEELLELETPPTAIFAASDEMAIEILFLLQRKGVNVPCDISLIGFDDNPVCNYSSVPLTTIRQPLDKMASLGVRFLKERIEKKKRNKAILSPELVIRESVNFK